MINAEESKSKVYYVYNYLGGGFLEKVYENALCKKLTEAGFKVY